MAWYLTEIGWYSHCPTKQLKLGDADVGSEFFGNGPIYLVVEQGTERQPEGKVFDNYIPALVEPVGVVGGPTVSRWRYFEIWLVEDQHQ